jgi:hypothetical protein
MELPLYSYMIALCCLAVALWNLYRLFVGRSSSSSKFSGTARQTGEKISQFQKRIRALGAKVDMVEEHSGEYFMVLNENGWATVIGLLESLDKVSTQIDALVANDKSQEALKIIDWLDGAEENSRSSEIARYLVGIDCSSLRRWDDTVNGIIVKVAISLQDAAEDTRRLGIDRKYKRKPTLAAVDELMRMLEKRQAQKSSVKDW